MATSIGLDLVIAYLTSAASNRAASDVALKDKDMTEDPSKITQTLNNFMQASLITEVLVVVGLIIVFGIVMALMLRRSTASISELGKTVAESVATLISTGNDYRKQRDEAVVLVSTGERKLQAEKAERESERAAFTQVIASFAETEAKKLDLDRQRTEAWVGAAKSLDQMRSENEKALIEERTNIQSISSKIDTLRSDTTALVSASHGLPEAVANAIKPELADVKALVERLGSFLDAIDATKLEFGQKLDQAKLEVIQSMSMLQQRLSAIASQSADSGSASGGSDPLTLPMKLSEGS
jgi:chromosome segregation ATPase